MHKLIAHRRQFAVYVSGGLVTAATDVGLMQLLIASGMHYASATTAGFLAGLLVNYAFHSRVTFAHATTPLTFMRFMCVVGLNYLLTMACVALSVSLLGEALPGKIVALPAVALNGYVLGKFWIFR
jgi:putative flippase GtrA